MTKYIDKATVVAEIERRIEAHKETLKNCDSSVSEMVLKGSMSAYQSLLHFLDTLETKEVDDEYNGKAMLHILEKGVKQGKREMIDKACEWWEKELSYPSMPQKELKWVKCKVKEFRKAMEE